MSDSQARIAELLRPWLRRQREAEELAELIAQLVHPRIETVEQLDALPDGAVIHVPHKVTASSAEKRCDWWWPNRAQGPFHHGFRDELLPAILLWHPEVDRV